MMLLNKVRLALIAITHLPWYASDIYKATVFNLLDYVTHLSENWDFIQKKDLEIQW